MTYRSALFLSCLSKASIVPSGDQAGSAAPGTFVACRAEPFSNTQMLPSRPKASLPPTATFGCGGMVALARGPLTPGTVPGGLGCRLGVAEPNGPQALIAAVNASPSS